MGDSTKSQRIDDGIGLHDRKPVSRNIRQIRLQSVADRNEQISKRQVGHTESKKDIDRRIRDFEQGKRAQRRSTKSNVNLFSVMSERKKWLIGKLIFEEIESERRKNRELEIS